MAQWINVFRNNSLINPTRLPLLCRNSRALALAELGLTAGWLAGWLTDTRDAGKFQILKIKTHGSESRGQGGSSKRRPDGLETHTREYYTATRVVKIENAITKKP